MALNINDRQIRQVKILAFVFVAFMAFRAIAQTNGIRDDLEIVTNWVKPGPYLRVVNGVTYNINYSRLWALISKHEELNSYVPDGDDIYANFHLHGLVKQVYGSTVLYDIYRERDEPERITLMMRKTSDEYVKSVVILNCPYTDRLVTGQDAQFLCMKTTNYLNKAGASLVAYDCGVQSTNLVPVVEKVKKAKIVSEP
jgi:hypothetical protein